MSEIKWIKLSTKMFEDEKIRLIEKMPEADTILIIWVKLLAQAGKTNASGYIFLSENIPYTDEMLATIFNRPLNTVRMALETFQRFGMIEIDDQSYIKITNWEKHQNIEGMERIRKQTRERVRRHREQKKLEQKEQNKDVTLHETLRNAPEEDKEEDKERDKDIDYESIIDYYHSICTDFPKIRVLSDKRKKHLKARIKEHGIETVKEVFDKASKSDFLSGRTKDWNATFDWLINKSNFIKVLEGNYDNKEKHETRKVKVINGGRANETHQSSYEQDYSKYDFSKPGNVSWLSDGD